MPLQRRTKQKSRLIPRDKMPIEDRLPLTLVMAINEKEYNLFLEHECVHKYQQGAIGGRFTYEINPNDNDKNKVTCACRRCLNLSEGEHDYNIDFRQEIDHKAWREFGKHECDKRENTFILTPTTLGTAVRMRCACGKTEDLTRYQDW